MGDNMHKFTVTLADETKKKLERMANETGISQSHLIRMAAHSLVVNYENKGSFIFADLLNPDHKD